jgi:hypothetical protein
MGKKLLTILVLLLIATSVQSCKKKEPPQTPEPGVSGPMQPGQMPPGPVMQGPISPEGQQAPGHGMMTPGGKAQVNVPDFVKGKWDAAKIIIEDKATKKRHEYTVKLNSDFPVPNSKLKLSIGEYLPDFKMEGFSLTSVSNNPNNPALAVKIFENDKKIFPAPGKEWGWLFEKVPTIHPFEHEKYGVILKEGIKKG